MDILRLGCPKSPLALRPKNNNDVRGSLNIEPGKPKQSRPLLWRTLDVATGLRGGPGAQTWAVGRAAKPHPGVTSAARRGARGGKWGFLINFWELELFSASRILFMCMRCRLIMRNILIEVSQLLNTVDMYQLHHSPNLYQCVSNNQLASH